MIPSVPWSQLLQHFAGSWHQGEHVALIGPTGTGKSTLSLQLMKLRRYGVVLATKPRDETLSRFLATTDYERSQRWPARDRWGRERERVVLWPKYRNRDDKAHQADVLGGAMDDVFGEGGWTINLDEVFYLSDLLGLDENLVELWTQGRSNYVTVVAATQKPSHVPTWMYSMSTHLFLWNDPDKRNRDRFRDISGGDGDKIANAVLHLPEHDVLYVDTRRRTMVRTRAPRI